MVENARLNKQEALAKRLANLPPQKRDAFLKLLQREGIDATKLPILPAERQTNRFPLSWSQERLWFINQFEGPSAIYNIHLALKINGPVQVDVLQKTLNAIARRHDVLRTSFDATDGKPVQIIHDTASWPLQVEDWQDWAADGQEPKDIDAKIQAFAQQQAQKPFDLTQAPLARASLVQLSPTSSVLFLEIHHIIWDAWSMGVFSREFSRFYQAYSQQQAPTLSPLPIQYVDYAVWQRQWLFGKALTAQLDYWKQQLADAPILLNLPTDRPRPSVQSFQGNTQVLRLDATLSKQVVAFAQQHQVTLFMVLLTAFKLLLQRYSGQYDVIVGSPIANRQRAELESLLGFFINTLALRTQIKDDDSVSDLLNQVRRTTLDAYAHQDVPFEQIVEALQPKRTLAHSPIFQVMFVLQNASMPTLDLPNLTLTPVTETTHSAKFDLTLEIEDSAQGLVGYWIYNTDLFDADTITRIGHHFEILLRAMIEDVSQPLRRLPLLSPAERQQILVDWNDTAVVYPQGQRCIHELFEQQVSQAPDAIAVVYEQEQLTYQDLNNKANQLAHYLQELGVGPDILVGICVERSLEMVIGLLAILKAGGAYVPIDPSYPQERIQFMLQDAQVSLLLTQTSLLEKLPQTPIFCLDRDWSKITHPNTLNLNTKLTPDNLAYVIYTSGSTGQPKGVMNRHEGICNRLLWMQETYNLTPADRVLQKTPFSFDVSVWEFFWPLITGAKLIVAKPEGHKDSSYLIDLIVQQQITTAHFVPSMLAAFLQDPDLDRLKCLKRVICSGEALSVQLQQGFFAHLNCELHNLYGPTEAAIDVTAWSCQPSADTSVPIGYPIANTQIYILDQELQPVPVGVPGELHIGGTGLARGYLNRPELTQERFITNPFSRGRLYKTGDLARYRRDGAIEYLGRIDFQVKLRGFRIELGEIEAVLAQHEQVQQCVAMVREDTPGNKRLVAYVFFDDDVDSAFDGESLKTYLKQHLPDYMVPSVFVPLDALPLTPNGKIDRKALAAPVDERSSDFVAPQTDSEKTLADIWQDILGQEQIGIHDNFFELGGDSILSIQMIAQARKAGLPLNPKQLFQHQTISELAYALTHEADVPILAQQGKVTGPVPLVSIQRWFLEQNWSNPHHFNQALLLQVPSGLEEERLRQSLANLVTHHDALRLRFEHRNSQWYQYHTENDGEIPLERVDLSQLSGAEQAEKMSAIATKHQASLHLSQGPIGHVVLFALGNSQQRLLLIFHHLVIDGVSWRILLEDLWDLYTNAAPLPPKTTAYQDWALQLETYSQSTELQRDYWLNLPWSQVTPLPVDAHGTSTVAEAATLSTSLGVTETQQLLQQVPEAYNTQINDALLTALVDVIGTWTGDHNAFVNLEGHGREPLFETVDVSRTVGWFTSLYPVLLTTNPQVSPGENLKAVKESLREIPQGGLGYGLLRYTAQDTSLSPLPTPQLSFNYLGQIEKGLDTDWSLAPESVGDVHSPDGQRPHLIDITVQTVAEKLQISWSYSRSHHHPETIEKLAQNYIHALKTLIDHCLSADTGGYTPSDFPMVDLSQADLDDVMQQLDL